MDKKQFKDYIRKEAQIILSKYFGGGGDKNYSNVMKTLIAIGLSFFLL